MLARGEAVRLWVGLCLAALCAAVVAGLPAPPPASAAEEVVTAASENLRTGWYPDETSLTPQLLREGRFERSFATPVQGQIYAQPLVADGVLLAATEEDWVYGLDPVTGAVEWSRQVGAPLEASTLHCWPIEPDVGITGAPVIDATHGVAYFAAISYIDGTSGPVAWYLHALALATGEEEPGFPVEIAGHAQNLLDTTFEAERQLQRPALLLLNGVVYAAFGGDHCNEPPYQGWVVGVLTTSHDITAMWATATEGASIWQSGAGLVSTGPNQILLTTATDAPGVPDVSPPSPGSGKDPPADLGESVVALTVQPDGELQATDFFSPADNVLLDEQDLDFGSGGPMALPPQFGTPSVPHPVLQTSKTGVLFLLNGEDLGGMGQGPGGGNDVVQELGPYGGVWDGLAAWPGGGGYVYVPSVSPPSSNNTGSAEHLRFFSRGVSPTGQPELSLAATSPELFAYGTGAPIVTSDGTAAGSGILWIDRCPEPELQCTAAELRAYEAVPSGGAPVLLWSAPIGFGPKFARPDAAGGRIYVGTRGEQVLGFAPTATPPLTGAALAFPETFVGQSSELQATLTATRAVEVTNLSSTDPEFSHGQPSRPLPAALEPGQQLTVPVTYAPDASGPAHATLTVETAGGSLGFGLSGSAVLARLTPSHATLALGTAEVGHRLKAPLQLTNTGEVPLTVSAVQPPAAPFAASGLPAEGAQLEPGQSVTVTVSFESSKAGNPFRGSLALTTQAGRTVVSLTATATAPPPPKEPFPPTKPSPPTSPSGPSPSLPGASPPGEPLGPGLSASAPAPPPRPTTTVVRRAHTRRHLVRRRRRDREKRGGCRRRRRGRRRHPSAARRSPRRTLCEG